MAQTMPFKQNSDLFWLSGVDQEESKLLLFPDCENENHREILFLKETSDLIAIWEGAKLTKSEAFEVSGVKTVYWNSEFEEILSQLMNDAEHVYLNSNEHARATSKVERKPIDLTSGVNLSTTEKTIISQLQYYMNFVQ